MKKAQMTGCDPGHFVPPAGNEQVSVINGK
jgi:hypothetical protein